MIHTPTLCQLWLYLCMYMYDKKVHMNVSECKSKQAGTGRQAGKHTGQQVHTNGMTWVKRQALHPHSQTQGRTRRHRQLDTLCLTLPAITTTCITLGVLLAHALARATGRHLQQQDRVVGREPCLRAPDSKVRARATGGC